MMRLKTPESGSRRRAGLCEGVRCEVRPREGGEPSGPFFADSVLVVPCSLPPQEHRHRGLELASHRGSWPFESFGHMC
jgi:hypothetical protein